MEKGLVYTGGKEREVPLKGVKIRGNICGFHGEFQVSQTYQNDTSSNIEIIYTFPLPDKATVTDFYARAGERRITSQVWEREKAFEVYDKALRKGDRSFLLEQYRPNLFQVSLGQVLPGEKVEVFISYLEEIKYQDGEIRILIPTLVAPRYIPGKPAGKRQGMGRVGPTDRVPDADFITPPVGEGDYQAQLDLVIDPPIKLNELDSPSHPLKVVPLNQNRYRISFARGEVALDRDIIITGKGMEETTGGSFFHENSQGEKHLYLSLLPELESWEIEETPKNYIFLLDISGSMMGEKLEQAKNALQLCLRNLNQQDTFNLLAFESRVHLFSRESLPFNQKSLKRATRWIQNLRSLGGTEILSALEFSLENCPGKDTCLLLFTDGQVGNEEEIFDYLQKHIRGNRIFTFGIDTAVNSYFLNGLAEKGSGLAEFIYPGERIEDKVLRQFSRITSPRVEGVEIGWGDLKVEEVYPPPPREIFNLDPLTLVAKVKGEVKGQISLGGSVGGERFQVSLDLPPAPENEGSNLLEKLWARFKINTLEESLADINPRREKGVIEEIVKLARDYKVSSGYTSFVAVEERENKAPGQAGKLPKTIVVPVSPPVEWNYFPGTLDRGMDSFIHSISPVGEAFEEDISAFKEGLKSCSFTSPGGPSPSWGPITREWRGEGEDMERALDKAFRCLALKQQADGSFALSLQDNPLERLKYTSLTILAFLLGPSDASLYKRQLLKSLEYLADHAKKDDFQRAFKKEEITHYLVTLTLKILVNRGIGKGKLKEKVEVVFKDLCSPYNRERAPLLFQESLEDRQVAREVFKTLGIETGPFQTPEEAGLSGKDLENMEEAKLPFLCLARAI